MEHRWRWLESSGATRIPTVYSTGTVDVAANAATVVGASVSFATGVAGRKIRLGIDNSEYTIQTRSSATRLVLSASYRGDAISDGAYSIYQDTYYLPIDCEEVVDVYRYQPSNIGRSPLEPITKRQWLDMKLRTPFNQDFAYRWTHANYSSGGTRQFHIWPAGHASRDYRIHYEYIKQITTLSATGDKPLMPLTYRPAIAYGALEKIFVQQGLMQRAAWARKEYDTKVAKMITDGETTDRRVELHHRGGFSVRPGRRGRRYDIDTDTWNDGD